MVKHLQTATCKLSISENPLQERFSDEPGLLSGSHCAQRRETDLLLRIMVVFRQGLPAT